MKESAPEVVVLGAGIIGVMIAERLQREGARVTLLDAQSTVAAQTSRANGGQLSFASGGSWSGREVAVFLLRGALSMHRRPWGWRWRSLPRMWRWALEEDLDSEARLAALLRLSAEEFESMITREQDLSALVDGRGVWALGGARRGVAAGHPPPSPVRLGGAQSVFYAGDIYADCRLFAETLARRFVTGGGRLRLGARVHGIDLLGRRIRLSGPWGELMAERLVLATGLATNSLLAPLGYSTGVPLFPLQGYSLTYPCASDVPRFALLDERMKVVITRLGSSLRVAGLLDFGRDDMVIRPPMLRTLEAVVRRWVPDLVEGIRPTDRWACVRPMAPGGVPVVGYVDRQRRILCATGHGHLGWTLAAGTGRLVRDLLGGYPSALPPDDYAPRPKTRRLTRRCSRRVPRKDNKEVTIRTSRRPGEGSFGEKS